jgi:hypothetical protein
MLLAQLGDARVSGDLVEDLLPRHQLPEESSLKKGMVSLCFVFPDLVGFETNSRIRIRMQIWTAINRIRN